VELLRERDARAGGSRRFASGADLAARRELFSAANHELRTPLASVIAALQLLREGAYAPSGQSRESFLELALQNAERLARAVEQWLDLDRIDLDVGEIRCVPLALAELVAVQVRASATAAVERGVELVVVEQCAVRASADPQRLAQAIAHLLACAIERSPPGAQVRILVGVRGQSAVVLIEDQGPEVPAGTDLALGACKAIVERQGGTLQLTSRGGRGALFQLELPCC
jgi:signal transduction histidine kinase